MTIELTLLISLISVGFALFMGIINWRRTTKYDDKQEARQIATILEKLANISLGIAELKENLSELTNEQGDLKERLAKAEASIKQAHKRIDELIKKG